MSTIALVGNPNCGKTTLFNALTGERQRVGNWPGVTVEKKTGKFTAGNKTIEVVDLPGIYSLACIEEETSLDERIAAVEIAFGDVELLLNIVDACHLERHLYLTTQLLELGKPVIIALTMTDIAKQQGISIDVQALAKKLGCPVIPVIAHRQIGIIELKNQVITPALSSQPLELSLNQTIQEELLGLREELINKGIMAQEALYLATRIFEGDTLLASRRGLIIPKLERRDNDIIFADARYRKIHAIVLSAQTKKSDVSEFFTAKIDKLLLHRFWSIPLFLCIMYALFLFAINIGGALQDFFDISSDALFVQGTTQFLVNISAPQWLIALLANGVGKGINTTVTFIPVIAAMFFFLSFLESCGYMARAAFIVDRAMRYLGLPGKAFVPMIVGFGCNVPAIMGARILESDKDRILTILMSPFMSCSARLAIYTVFVSAFFPTGGHNIVFSLYLIGIFMAVMTGLLLRKLYFKTKSAPLIMELPTYHVPTLKRLMKDTYIRLRIFVVRAGKIIIPVCIILGFLNALTINGVTHGLEASTHSILSYFGHLLTPLFSPMGITPENWPATVGLLTGMLAKEVVIGSLNALYMQVGHLGLAVDSGTHFNLWASLHMALMSIVDNFKALGQALVNPILASAPEQELKQPIYGVMYQYFGSPVAAYAYLLFILLYIPCVSTMAVIKQEVNQKWMWFSILWSLFVAYALAVLFYQMATVMMHPLQSMQWLSILLVCFIMILWALKRTGKQQEVREC